MGLDLSAAMITQARQLWRKRGDAEFVVASVSPRVADYSIASGIFNVKLDHSDVLWTQFVEATLRAMQATSRRGFAINFLAPLADSAGAAPELYRVSPSFWATYCEREFGASVEVLDNYGMREYTLLVRTC